MRFKADEEYLSCLSKIYDDGAILTNNEVQNYLNSYREDMLKLSIKNEKLKLHLHILEEVVYMLDQEVVRAMEDGFESSDWYLNYLAKGTEDLE